MTNDMSPSTAAADLPDAAPDEIPKVFRFQPLVGRRTLLRPVGPQDYDFLYSMAVLPENSIRWRFRGRSLSIDTFVQSLWQDVLCQYVIESRQNREIVGHVTSFRPEFRNGTAHLGVMVTPGARDQGWPLEGVVLFLDHLFLSYPLRKLYAETLEFNLSLFGAGVGRLFVEEGRLRQDEYHDGRYWDNVFLALYREAFEERVERVLGPDRYTTFSI